MLGLLADVVLTLLGPPTLIVLVGAALDWRHGRSASAQQWRETRRWLQLWVVVGGITLALWELVR